MVDLGAKYGDRARAMTRDEWKALRQHQRDQWSTKARRQHVLARRNAIRFAWFTGGMFVVACVIGALVH